MANYLLFLVMAGKKPIFNKTHEELEEEQLKEWGRMSGEERIELVLFLSLINKRNFRRLQPNFWEGDFVLQKKKS